MKKTFAALLMGLFALTVAASAAPDGNERGISGYGPMLGMSLAKFCEKDFENGLKAGLILGGFVNYQLTQRISLAGQLLFVQKGYTCSDTDAFGIYKSRRTLNYFELPILAKYSFGENTLGYYAFAGPSFGFQVGGKYTYEYDGVKGEDTDMSHFKVMDLGLRFGGGLDYPICSGRLGFELGFELGLCNIYADSDGYYSARNFAVLLMFFYVFGGR